MVQKAEIPLADAVRMASETPARIMGVLDRKGTLGTWQGCGYYCFGQRLECESCMGDGTIGGRYQQTVLNLINKENYVNSNNKR